MSASLHRDPPLVRMVAAVTALALAFQYGHFLEHVIQAGAWLAGHTDTPYMTQFGYWLSHQLGAMFFGYETPDRVHRLGMELLHLLGNAIYLIGIIGLWGFVRTRLVLIALIIEGLHVFEHVMLTLTTFYFDQAIGLSTLYGYPMSNYVSVAYRVWWHFLANAIPTALVTCALFDMYRQHVRELQAVEVSIPRRLATHALFSNSDAQA